MRRLIALCVAAVMLAVPLTGCQRKVEVKTGARVVCTYGHVISDDVRTVRVPADQASGFRVRTETKTCPLHLKLEGLYEDAQAAITKGDLKTAKAKLKSVVDGDAGFRNAASQLDAIESGKKPAPDTGGTGGSTPATSTPKPGGGTGDPSGALTSWIPELSGYTARKPTVDPLSVAREYVPVNDDSVVHLVIVAEQFNSSASAVTALNNGIKPDYRYDRATVQFNGHTAFFGTDRNRFAVLAFVDDGVLVALSMGARESGDPVSMKSAIIAAAKQLP